MTRRISVCLCALGLAACATASSAPPAAPPDAARARAALAAVTVDNRTDERLAILYRLTIRPATEITVGAVPPASVVDTAPVPAGEPLILLARTAQGRELALPPRSLAVGAAWTWTIPADARFRIPGDTAGAR